ncbi:MAG: FIST signal transduction protein [Actinomycetota bacterium]
MDVPGNGRHPGRWMAVGQSNEPDPDKAGRQAAEAAVGDDARLLIVFSSENYDLEILLAAIRKVSGDVPLIGCSTAGEIATSGPNELGVVVVALGGLGFEVSTACATGAKDGLRDAGTRVASSMEQVASSPNKVLVILSDGLAGDQQEIVRGAYSVVGAAVPLVGGCAGDDMKMKSTYQFFDDRVLKDAVVAAAIGSSSPFGIGVRHGWRKVGEPMLVSRSGNNRVYTLDDRPALDAYLERLKAPAEAATDPAAFTLFAMTHPLGLSKRTGEPHVRFVAEADFQDRSLVCIAEVPTGALAWLMEGDESSVLEATDDACTEALDALGGAPPIGMLTFDCIARRGVLGEGGIKAEIERVSTHAPGTPVAGFYTYGEFARIQGMSGFHNQTLVVLAVS